MAEPQPLVPPEEPSRPMPHTDDPMWDEPDVHPARIEPPRPDTVPQPEREAA